MVLVLLTGCTKTESKKSLSGAEIITETQQDVSEINENMDYESGYSMRVEALCDIVFDNRSEGFQKIYDEIVKNLSLTNFNSGDDIVFNLLGRNSDERIFVDYSEETIYCFQTGWEKRYKTIAYGPNKQHDPDLRFYYEKADESKLTEEQRAQLKEIEKVTESSRMIPREKAVCLGLLEEKPENRLSYEQVKELIEKYKDEGYEKIIDEIYAVYTYFDYEGGNNDTPETIVLSGSSEEYCEMLQIGRYGLLYIHGPVDASAEFEYEHIYSSYNEDFKRFTFFNLL